MKFKGTPTPWEIREGNGLLFVESSKENLGTPYGQEILADDYHNEDWKKHDVKLVAAAPELLNALSELLIHALENDLHSEFTENAKNVINKIL